MAGLPASAGSAQSDCTLRYKSAIKQFGIKLKIVLHIFSVCLVPKGWFGNVATNCLGSSVLLGFEETVGWAGHGGQAELAISDANIKPFFLFTIQEERTSQMSNSGRAGW